MGRFLVLPDVVAVAADRLVVIVSIDSEGAIIVRDLASGIVRAATAAELSALPASPDSVPRDFSPMVQATDAQWEQARAREAVISGLLVALDLAAPYGSPQAGALPHGGGVANLVSSVIFAMGLFLVLGVSTTRRAHF